MASTTHEGMSALPLHTVTQLGLEERRHPICAKGKASAKPIISPSLGAKSGKNRALQWERGDGRKQNKNINPSQSLGAQHAALCTHCLLLLYASPSHGEIQVNSSSKYQPITALSGASGICMQEECEGKN